ncbi:MAG: hypothetical protein Q8R24_10540 [Legionellaceae bacterium]|nr:hypothetical protein [Legionellaceae bacterium]
MANKNNRTPRRKRMQRSGRLQSAKHWIPTYSGGSIVKGYKNWFGVSLVCAIKELRMLGVKLDEQYVLQALKGHEHAILDRQKKKVAKKQELLDDLLFDSDDHYYFIAGYTSGGFPYGITWEEAELDNLIEPF